MTEYEFCLGLGFLGLAVMAFGGLFSRGAGRDNDASNVSLPGHGGGANSVGGAHAPAAHLPTHSAPSTLALGRAGGVRGGAAIVAGAKATRGGAAGRRVLGWLSPRVMFSVLVGFGAAGLAMQGYVAEPIRLMVAVVLGVLFEIAAVGGLFGVWCLGSALRQRERSNSV